MFEISMVEWRLAWRPAWRMFFCGCCGQCLGLVVVWFLGLVVAWWPVSCGCCGGFLVILVVAIVLIWWRVFGPSRFRVVAGFDSGLILFYGFDSHRGCGCSVWWVFLWWFCGWRWWWILWVLFLVGGVGFFNGGGDGFFFWWWWWVSCVKGGGDGWLKKRNSEEKIKRVMGEKRERETERERLDYIILLSSIYYFNELNRKIKVGILSVL